MKKVALLLCTALVLITACAKTEQQPPVMLPEEVSLTHNGLTVSVKPALELISIVQYIGDDGLALKRGLITRYDFDYKREIDEYFRKFSDHPAVKYYEKMDVYAIHEVPAMALLLNADFTVVIKQRNVPYL